MLINQGGQAVVHRKTLLLIVAVASLSALGMLAATAPGAGQQAASREKAANSEEKNEKDKPESKRKPGLKKVAMQALMRKKLEASQSVLEGLALEDFELIAKGARQLGSTAAAAEFMVFNDPLYTEYADDFRRITNKMETAAKEKRIDGATLAY